ncbi:MAG: hypothetical protein COB85_03705 [Bacteroidetes bacterium]|nr:MAG: hypothetical protein COB85_03705 [Bacteroidota bacterium]
MKLRIANIRFGVTGLFVTAVMGGMALGGTFDSQSVQDGNHLLALARFYIREGHSHGNFMCLFNLFVGIILNNLELSERMKKICSYSAMIAIFLPLGLALKGFAGAPADFPPIGLIGIIGVATALIILIIGAWKTKQA